MSDDLLLFLLSEYPVLILVVDNLRWNNDSRVLLFPLSKELLGIEYRHDWNFLGLLILILVLFFLSVLILDLVSLILFVLDSGFDFFFVLLSELLLGFNQVFFSLLLSELSLVNEFFSLFSRLLRHCLSSSNIVLSSPDC